ncbi:HNH endonuclease [Streptomyces sp. NPDC058637]|uniref:HNH endonuclease n=1 Tax=Streptomyces sp. NPDC058637 TaxID=3346569 RepID=UPI00365A4BB6
MTKRTCAASGCDRIAASRRGMCSMHYQRVWKQERSCSVEGCARPYAAKNLCAMHYKRQRKGQSFDIPPLGAGKAAGCSVDGCESPYAGRGFCGVHLQRFRRTGDPLAFRSPRRDGCEVAGCEEEHFGLGYCRGHYKRVRRLGTTGEKSCKLCQKPFERPIGKRGSYDYCSECLVAGPAAWAALRRQRLAANNVGMTEEGKTDSREYRSILSNDPCVFCGVPSRAVDHILPVVNGGSDRWDNLAPVCQSCNSSKHDRDLMQFLLLRLGELASPPGCADGYRFTPALSQAD